ncbi:glycerol-3-phosphate dehydrogenase [Chenggangzhangella methanolivorans]|uniref:Glycerol-3-phosphate dehydrogenase n=1 Tax=Chenggangzhangella methanolivorans TaxID=1437009 RepID=A0A9E6R8C7_9HYPH|nr:glycerol-3-phosphate dehydrogenase [Chenggangzhangella methanolivorans]QZN99174.1 glycerol-3-phosphate dehydrogenase [Chenggangzhangella methanolivorans]
MKLYDLAIIGGGVNGCGIARDAAGRGLAVHLCEKGDLGSGTSSASTKLAHGGLRYLETMEFRLVREALAEREALLRIAPHIVRPMRFVLPHRPGLRAWPIIRLGLFVYDSLGGRRTLSGSRSIDLARDDAGASLRSPDGRAFEYSDCWVDDARLVVLNAMDAAERGATIATRTACVAAERTGGVWRVTLDGPQGRSTIRARGLVNAAGPWVPAVAQGSLRANAAADVRLVRGSHIVTPRLFEHDRAYLLQQRDGRVVFAIPYEDDFTLIGTTDVDHDGAPDHVEPSEAEIEYLCEAASDVFRAGVRREDVVWAFSGVRALHAGGDGAAQKASRDYALELEAGEGRPPLLTIYGGKLTTYRRLAEAALDKLAPAMSIPPGRWTGRSPLPGGGVPAAEPLADRLAAHHPYLSEALASRLARTYGSRAWDILDGATSARALGYVFGADLSEREVRYLVAREWAETAEDVLWRRTKLGLRFSAEERETLARFMPGGDV